MKIYKSTILEGRIFPVLTSFSIPILLSLILQALYGAVDLWMVSQFATNADISAVSTGSQTMMIIGGMVTGLSIGITVLLGQSVGQGSDKRGADIIGTSIWIFLGIGAVITAILLGEAKPLATLLNAPPAAYDKTVAYILICGAGTIFVVGFNVLNGIFCGLGDSKTPLLFVGVACFVNIVCDYVLIDLFHMGTIGAAIATITAQAVSVLFSLLIIRKKLPFPIGKANMRYNRKLAGAILRLGAPVAILRMCTELSYLVILGFVNVFGEVSSSGVGIAEKLVMFILLIPTAYMSSISVFVAQNIGAKQSARAKKAFGSELPVLLLLEGLWPTCLFFTEIQCLYSSPTTHR